MCACMQFKRFHHVWQTMRRSMSKFVAKYPYSPLVLPFMFLLYLMITTYWITATRLHFADHLFLIPTHSQMYSLRKLAHAIYRYFLSSKTENFLRKKIDIFLIFAQNIDCGYTLEPPRRGGSNEYPQSMVWSKNKKNRYTPAYPSFAI